MKNKLLILGYLIYFFMRNETIENYLKTIYNLSSDNTLLVSNKALADKLALSPATVTEGLRKLDELKYVIYEKSYGTRLTASGAKMALNIVRRHRIWETYLVKELGFGWDEVHEIAEELEHIKNDKLIKKLASILGNPIYDPHGDPIPDEKGKIQASNFIRLSEIQTKAAYKIMGVTDHSSAFLKYLERHQLLIGTSIHIKSVEEFDHSMLLVCHKKEILISSKAAETIIVQKI
jgi:DtxR family Mn-dependent transcriptional regulator